MPSEASIEDLWCHRVTYERTTVNFDSEEIEAFGFLCLVRNTKSGYDKTYYMPTDMIEGVDVVPFLTSEGARPIVKVLV